MPRLQIPQTKRNIQPVSPATIQSPEQIAGQATQPMAEVGETLAKTGAAFTEQILRRRENSEIATAQGDIERMMLEAEMREKAGVDEDGKTLTPEAAPQRFNEVSEKAMERIEGAQGSGAREYLKNWWSKQATNYQRSYLTTVSNTSVEQNAVKYSQWFTESLKQPARINIEGAPSNKELAKQIRKGIDDRISYIEQGIVNFASGNPKVGARADDDIEKVNDEVTVNTISSIVYDYGREHGTKWLKDNRDGLGLTLGQYDEVLKQLNKLWDREEAVSNIAREQRTEQINSQIWENLRESNFGAAQQIVDESDLPVTGMGGKEWWNDVINTRVENIREEREPEDNYSAILQINDVADELWMGQTEWQDYIHTILDKERQNLIKPRTRNELIREAESDLEDNQKQEATNIFREARDLIVKIPDPEEEPMGWEQARKSRSTEDEDLTTEDLERERSNQILRYNNFRSDFQEWLNFNPQADYYEIQEKRLELLYGKYVDVEQETLKARIEQALEYDIGDERINEEGNREVYIGAGRWQEEVE